ncbi:MAG: site-specific DNA-methyltransferase [Candidatus Sericytochromatia bacterium]|nr:site-specific DNA-methyltransferase [Candidatus Sericytochromatia bacterium]
MKGGESEGLEDEEYGLVWPGRRAARALAEDPPMHVLEERPGRGRYEEATKNLLVEGDNLEAMKLLRPGFAGVIKLAYLDPPYNTGRQMVYADRFRQSVRRTGPSRDDGHVQVRGRRHSAWLSMMLPRLLLVRELLHPRGAVMISLDDAELPRARELCDEVFGPDQFLATLVWEKAHTRKNSAKGFSVSHEYVLVYARNAGSWDRVLLPRVDTRAYRNPDGDPKGPWKLDPITAHNPYGARYSLRTPWGTELAPPEGRFWAFSEETLRCKEAEGALVWGRPGRYPLVKRYLSETQDGLVPTTLLSRTMVGDTATARRELDALLGARGVFEYPKPLGLMRHLLRVATRPGDVVLDVFGGSGSMAHAVWLTNLEDEGSRRWITLQQPEALSTEIARQRASAEFCLRQGQPCNLAQVTRLRLLRAAETLQSLTQDLGFKVSALSPQEPSGLS